MANELVALVGNPNCGKTALFNSLTGGRQKVANYPGVTVDLVQAFASPKFGASIRIMDLPGTYSLNPHSDDEAVTRDLVKGKAAQSKPDLILNVIDATNFELGIGLTLDLLRQGIRVVVALNMIDLSRKQGRIINRKTLETMLGVPVVEVSATNNLGLNQLIETVTSELQKTAPKIPENSDLQLDEKNKMVNQIVKEALEQRGQVSKLTASIDKVVLHPIAGPLVLLLILGLVFQAVFSWATLPMDLIENLISRFSDLVANWLPEGALKSLLIDGIIGGVGSVVVFLPQIVILFSFIIFLEDFGYMARASYLMDRLMGAVGLSGKAVLPLVSGLACAVPSILATRSISSRRDQLLTMMLAPLMTCSARLPVYTLLIAAFIPAQLYYGINLQGVVLLLLYVGGVLAVLAVGFLLQFTILKGESQPLLLELPTYKWPSPRLLLKAILDRGRIFLKRAGTFIMAVSVILWAVTTYPKAPENPTKPEIEYSFAGQLGKILEPVMRPVGFNYEISVALIPGFAAREVMVSSLGTVYAIEGEDEDSLGASLSSYIESRWSMATALALLAWYVFAPQCLATFAVLGRESRSWKTTGAIFSFYLFLSWMAAFVVNKLTLWILS